MASDQAVAAAMAVWGIGDWSDALEAAFPIMLREKMNGREFTWEDVAEVRSGAGLYREHCQEHYGEIPDDWAAAITRMESLAARIEALLPPETPDVR